MKTLLIYLFIAITAISFLIFCNKNSVKLKRSPNKMETLKLEKSILSYSDSVNSILFSFNKQESLFYYQGDNSFFVTKYHDEDYKNVVLVKHNHIGKQKILEQNFYIQNGKTVLISSIETDARSGMIASSIRYFYSQASLISQYEKSTQKENQLSSSIYNPASLSAINEEFEVAVMEDALKQQGDFDLVFEGITEYPKAKYIILSQDKINAYRAPIRVNEKDELATELLLNPERFRGRKLIITGKVKNKNEAIYISGKLK